MINKKRHILKTISYRLISTIIGFMIMFIISGSIKIGATISIIEIIYKPLQYYIHERIWYKYFKFGIKK
tara:strand:+ start:370 stop:576 length:207 start_codon:yes stop_codon:yes gene_type:complete